MGGLPLRMRSPEDRRAYLAAVFGELEDQLAHCRDLREQEERLKGALAVHRVMQRAARQRWPDVMAEMALEGRASDARGGE